MRCDGDMPTRLLATDLPATRILVPEGKGSAVREPMERTWAGKGLLEVASTKARFDMAAERSEARWLRVCPLSRPRWPLDVPRMLRSSFRALRGFGSVGARGHGVFHCALARGCHQLRYRKEEASRTTM